MEKTFEESILELEKIVEEMDNTDISLEESIKHFEDGIKLSKYCYKLLDDAEKKVTMVLEKNGVLVEENI